MSSSKAIESPHTLASLPHSVNGRTLATTVYGLHGSRKRKRTEVAVSVDGEGINIYNVQNPRLVASYALPPRTRSTAPPCSIYVKGSERRPSRRITYAPIAGSASESRPQIVCFAEDVKKASAGNPTRTSHTLPKSAKAVVSVDVLAHNTSSPTEDAAHDVLVIHADSQAVCMSADLASERWTENLNSLSGMQESSRENKNTVIECVSYTEAAIARKGLLKNREDVIALLDPTLDSSSGLLEAIKILCVVTSKAEAAVAEHGSRKLQLYSLRLRSPDFITSRRSPIQHLLTWDLPTPRRESQDPERRSLYSLHALSGTLHQLDAGIITTYDLSSTLPRVSSELGNNASSFQTFVRLSASLVLAASPTACGIYDVKYDSVQSVIPLGADSESSPSKKRKQSTSTTNHAPLDLLTYFGDIGLAVGLADDELIGIHIGTDAVPSKRNRVKEGLLIDSIGRGIGKKTSRTQKRLPGSLPKPLKECLLGPAEALDQTWPQKKTELDKHLGDGDVHEFERLFAENVGTSRVETMQHKGANAPSDSMPNGVKQSGTVNGVNGSGFGAEAEIEGEDRTSHIHGRSLASTTDERPLPDWQFPDRVSNRYRQAQRHKAIYALQKIFRQVPPSNGLMEETEDGSKPASIVIQFYPPNVFRWLVIAGFLTPDMVNQALRMSSVTGHDSTFIPSSDIISAIVEYDPDMHLLYSILEQPSYLDISQTATAIKHLIQSLDNTPLPLQTPRLLTNGTNGTAGSPPTDETDENLREAADAATSDLDHALSTLEDGLAIRSRCLRTALTKLHSFPPSHVASALRTTFSHHEIIFLIQILRIELADGGWTSRYIDAGPDSRGDEVGDPSDRGIVIIADLLNSALDAIGAAGWLVSGLNAADGGAEDLLHSLRLEVSAALEGTHEASFMRGLLDDFCRYGAKRQRVRGLPSAKVQRRKGKPVKVALETAEESVERRILPLGSKVESRVDEEMRVSAGGQARAKTKREIGYEISRRVGKYSFERIVI